MTETVYLIAHESGLVNYADTVMQRLGYETYNPVTFHTNDDPLVRFHINMHNLSAHSDAVVTMPGWEETETSHAVVLLAKALDIPVWVIADSDDPEVACVVLDIDTYEQRELDASVARHPAGKHPDGSAQPLAKVCVDDDAEDRPSARVVFGEVFGHLHSLVGGEDTTIHPIVCAHPVVVPAIFEQGTPRRQHGHVCLFCNEPVAV